MIRTGPDASNHYPDNLICYMFPKIYNITHLVRRWAAQKGWCPKFQLSSSPLLPPRVLFVKKKKKYVV